MSGSDSFVEMARVLRPWGREGAVAVALHTDRPRERFREGSVLEARTPGESRDLTVGWWRPHRGGAVLKFREVDGMDAAEKLRGARVGLTRARLEAVFGPRVLYDDLVGWTVESPGGDPLGLVTGVEEAGPQVLLLIETGERQALVPLHDDLCRLIDADRRRIILEAPPGLLDPEEGA